MKCHVLSCDVMRPLAPQVFAGPFCRACRAPGACLPSVSDMPLELLRFPESKRRPRSAPKARRHPGDVMFCHAMSCSAAPRPSPPASPKRRSPNPACRSSIVFRSIRAAAGLPAARPFFARIAWARARVRAGAVRAPDCAREPSAGRTSPVRSVGFFSRRREAGDGAARGCRFLLSHPTTVLQGSSPYRELFHNS